jgi:ribosomal protein S20
MPKIQSAKKALRQNARHRTLNLAREKKFKDTLKHYKKLIAGGKKDEAQKYFATLQKTIDKMAKVGFIKLGKAKRLKSRLSRQARTK